MFCFARCMWYIEYSMLSTGFGGSNSLEIFSSTAPLQNTTSAHFAYMIQCPLIRWIKWKAWPMMPRQRWQSTTSWRKLCSSYLAIFLYFVINVLGRRSDLWTAHPQKKWNSVIHLPQCPVSDPWYFRCLDLFGFHIVWSSKLWYAVPIIKLDLPDIWFVPDPCKHVQGPTSYALTHSCAFWGWTPNAVWIFLFPFKMWWPLWTKKVAHMY